MDMPEDSSASKKADWSNRAGAGAKPPPIKTGINDPTIKLAAVIGRLSPLHILLFTIGVILLAVVIAMLVVYWLDPVHPVIEILIDSLVLMAIIFPIVFFFVYRPLREYRNQQRLAELSALSEVSLAISELRGFPETSKLIFNASKNLIGATSGYIALAKEGQNEALFIDTGGFECAVNPNLPMPIRGLRERVYSSGKTIYINDFPASEWLKYLPPGHEDLTNVLFAPLSVEGEAVGLMGLANKTGGFTENDARMATMFGEMAAIALVHFETEQKLRAAQDELERRVELRTRELADTNLRLTTAVQILKSEIAERKRAENQLNLISTAMRTAANGVVITDREGTILWVNPAFSDMSGYPAEEVIGKNPRILKSNLHDASFYKALWETIVSGRVWMGELTNRRKDGTFYDEEQTITPVLDEKGTTTHFIAIKQDITERKRAERTIKQSQERFQAEMERSNAELQALSEAERKARQLAEILRDVSLALSHTLDLETVLNTLLEFVQKLVPYDCANVALLENEELFKVRAIRSSDLIEISRGPESQSFTTQNLYLKEMLATRSSLLVEDTHRATGWKTLGGCVHARNWLGLPLIAEGQVIGVCCLEKVTPGYFMQEHRQLAEAIAGQVAVAVQNAWLFEQVRLGRERLQALSRRLVEVLEQERLYIARELHDDASQALTSLKYGFHFLEKEMNDPDSMRAELARMKETTEKVLDNLHRLAMDLRPASLDHTGLVPSIQLLAESMSNQSGIRVRFKSMGRKFEKRLPEIEINLYRIVQEALTNALRHAHATNVDIIFEQDDHHIRVIVEDDGIGFKKDLIGKSGHLGLVGMQERIDMLDGTMEIDSIPGSGTTVVIEVPYAE